MPAINKSFMDANRGLQVIGVNVQEPDIVVRGYGYELELKFPLVLDTDASVAREYRVQGLPTSYFVDKDGIIRERNFGFMSKEVLITKLKAIGVNSEQ